MNRSKIYYSTFFRGEKWLERLRKINELQKILDMNTKSSTIDFAVTRTLENLKK